MSNQKNSMIDLMSSYLSKSDVYAATVIAKVSAYIFKYRLDNNLSQKEFAKKMGVSQGMVSKWESAEYNFTIETIAQIAEKLGVTFDIEFKPESEYLSHAHQYECGQFSQQTIWNVKNYRLTPSAA